MYSAEAKAWNAKVYQGFGGSGAGGALEPHRDVNPSGFEEAAADIDGEALLGARRGGKLWSRLQDAPYPTAYMVAFGAVGLAVSITAVVVGYIQNLNSLAAVALALPCNIFMLSFFVSAVEDGWSSLVRLGVGFCGFYASLAVIVCFSITQELVALASAFMFLLSSLWYLEISVKARGWDSWFQGLFTLWAWMRGGCPLVGVREPEPEEVVTILGAPPEPTVFTALLPVEERHPGTEWIAPKVGMKVKHVGQCLMTVSEKGNPMGPWEEGIIVKKTARQLRKWLVRNGEKTDADFKKFAKLGEGTVTYVGSIGVRVEWTNGETPGYYCSGEDQVYELCLFQEDQAEPEAGLYDDGKRIHDGGSGMLSLSTFVNYFMRRFCTFLWYWIAFFTYFAMLYVFEFSLTNYAVGMAASSHYAMKGSLYPVDSRNDILVHIYCKGPGPTSTYDGRPAVVIEAMEAFAQGSAVARLQDTIAERGVACVYDRVGFGYSSDVESTNAWTNRTPTTIAAQLHFAIKYGTDTMFNRKVSWQRTYKDANNKTQTEWVPIRPPYVLLGHSAGALYARQFAHDFPNDTAALILIDPLPADEKIRSAQQQALSPMMMQLCFRFLQPMGLVYTFFPFSSSIFTEQFKFVLQGGADRPYDDLDVLMWHIYQRQWCPSVLAEYEGLYAGDSPGVRSVAAADEHGYDMPTVFWVRDKRVENGKSVSSDDPQYPTAPVARRKGIGGVLDHLNQWLLSLGDGELVGGGQRRIGVCPSGSGECLSWVEVQRNLLRSAFRTPWIDPYTMQGDIKRGDAVNCAINGCTDYAPMENPVEIFDSVLDTWETLGFRDAVPSDRYFFRLYGSAADFDRMSFQEGLSAVLSHIKSENIDIIEDPTQETAVSVGAGAGSTQAAARRASAQGPPYDGYSGSVMGADSYVPLTNLGAYKVVVVLYAHKRRAIDAAVANLLAKEDLQLDPTAQARRTHFIHEWKLMSLEEELCTPTSVLVDGKAEQRTVCTRSMRDIFTTAFARPAYACPQNTYRNDLQCISCPIEMTSPTASTEVAACRNCAPSFDVASQRFAYSYLSCDGATCNACPPGTLSGPGALGLAACVPVPIFVAEIKGPSGVGATSEAITPHRQGNPAHRSFEVAVFRSAIARIADVPQERIFVYQPQQTTDLPDSRCQELRGGCTYRVSFELMTEKVEQLAAANANLRGLECVNQTEADACLQIPPGRNETVQAARSDFLEQFELISLYTTTKAIVDLKRCPDAWEEAEDELTDLVNFFAEGFSASTYACPSKFYRVGPRCVPCPDMTTSNAGASALADCRPFNTYFFVIKDASLTYEARTNAAVGGMRGAQPNAIDIYGAVTYYKIRGMALQPNELVWNQDPALGLQVERCDQGLNCFSAEAFRRQLSSVLGGRVTPNEVRLTKPYTCLNRPEHLSPAAARFDLCGPWPGLPPTPDLRECACGAQDGQEKCFWTLAPAMISIYIGGETDNDPVEVGTPAECAQHTLESSSGNSFTYHPDTGQCVPRIVDDITKFGVGMCSSRSPLCVEQALAVSQVITANLNPGAQQYWFTEDKSTCAITSSVDGKCSSARPLAAPSDLSYLMVNLHAETAAELEHADSVLVSGELGSAMARRELLDRYRITQVLRASDKDPARAPEGTASRERSLLEAGNLRADSAFALESSSFCPASDTAVCLTEQFDVSPDFLPSCRWDTNAAEYLLLCRGAPKGVSLVPRCNRQRALAPVCLTGRLIDGLRASGIPMEAGTYVEERFTTRTDDKLNVPVLLTRIDVSLVPDTGGNGRVLALAFSDGSVQNISLAASSSQNALTWRQVVYLRPVVTLFVRATVWPADAGTEAASAGTVQLSGLLPHGQELSEALDSAQTVNFFAPGYLASASEAPYQCPATTFRAGAGSGTAPGLCGEQGVVGEGAGCSCTPCAYPLMSLPGSTHEGNCTCPSCGDGRLSWQSNEQCDDGNIVSEDGCSSDCVIEQLQLCQGSKDAEGIGQILQSYTQKDVCQRLGSEWTDYGQAPFKPRYGAGAVVHNRAMWIVGGVGEAQGEFFNDAWFEDSNGGKCEAQEPDDSCAYAGPSGLTPLNWGLAKRQTLRNSDAAYVDAGAFPPRGFFAVVSWRGFIYLSGGADRSNWQTLAPANDTVTCARVNAVHECRLNRAYQDVWRSLGVPNGSSAEIEWSKVKDPAPWQERAMHSMVVYNDSLWLFAGLRLSLGTAEIGEQALKDVWRSLDGMEWTQVAGDCPNCRQTQWSMARADSTGAAIGRYGQAATVALNRIYMMGGAEIVGAKTHYLNDVWRTADGVDWELIVRHAEWGGRFLSQSLVYQDSLWVIGGQRCGNSTAKNQGEYERVQECTRAGSGEMPLHYGDVWVSTADGSKWSLATASAEWAGKSAHALLMWNNQGYNPPAEVERKALWILGGQSGFQTASNSTLLSYEF